MTAKTRSARSDGQRRGDLVEQQQLRVPGERPREVDHAQHAAAARRSASSLKSTSRSIARSRSRTAPWSVPRQPQVLRDRQVGHERRVLEHRREAEPGGLRRRARPHLAAADRDRARVGPDRPRSGIFTSVLLPAPFAPSSACTSPGSTTSVGGAQRDDRRRSSSQRSRASSSCMSGFGHARRAGREGAARPPPASSRSATAPLQAKSCLVRVGRPRLDLQPCAVGRRHGFGE